MFPNNKPNREFQSGLKTEERRRLRQDDRLRLRRADRENRLQKKRQVLTNRNSNTNNNNNSNNYNNSPQKHQEQKRKLEMLQQLPQYVKGCYSDHPATQFECTQRIRKLLSIEREPPIKAVIDSGVVTRLVQFLQFDKFDRLQFEAAWALTNIASGTAENTAVIIRYGAVPIFVKLLESDSMEVREQAIWALGNIAGDSPECRNLVLGHGALLSLLPLCNTNIQTQQQVTLLRNATWTLSNFCRGKPSPDWKYIQLALKALSIMITSDDDEILQDSCWAFSYLSDIDNDINQHNNNNNNNNGQNNGQNGGGQLQIRAIINSGSLDRLITLLDHTSPHVRHPALRTIGNIVTGCDDQTQQVINLGVLKKLHHLMTCDRPPIKRESCWTISNITAGSKEQIESVISNNLIPPLINILATEKFEVSKEALWAISNATSGGTDVQIKFLVNQGVIEPLCRFFNPVAMKSHKCLLVALEGIENILAVGLRICNGNSQQNIYARYVEEAGGVDYLEQLQANQSIPDEIYEKAAQIIKTFFGGQDDQFDNNNNNNNNMNNNNMNNNMMNNMNNNTSNNTSNNNTNNTNNNGTFGFGIGNNNNNNNDNNNAPPQFNF